MSIGRPLLALLSLFFLAGACLLIFLVILGGVTNTNPLDRIYFLEADTGNIPGAPTISRWTFYGLCKVNPIGRNDCGKHHPAFPLDPPNARNFGTTENVPQEFIGTSKYFYMTRFLFAFTLISIVFAVLALLTGLIALCSRIGSYISSFLCFIALIFQTIAAALMTAAYVKGRNAFNRNGQTAKLGVKAFSFMWTAVALLFLASLLYCGAGIISPRGKRGSGDRKSRGMFGGKGGHRKSKGDYSDRADGNKDDYA